MTVKQRRGAPCSTSPPAADSFQDIPMSLGRVYTPYPVTDPAVAEEPSLVIYPPPSLATSSGAPGSCIGQLRRVDYAISSFASA
jgi:hypothetical protein